jgi:hypothetical protein
MNHITYEIARMRRDDLLRAAATSMDGEPRATLAPRPRWLGRLWQLCSAGLRGTSQTHDRTLDGTL